MAGSTLGPATSGVSLAPLDLLNLGWNLSESAPDFLITTFCLVTAPWSESEQAVSYSLAPLAMAAPASGVPGMV